MPDRLLAPLSAAQRAAAVATRGPVAILAVAGAGKTRAVAHRIGYAVATEAQNPATGLALSYTTKAAAELRSRLTALGVTGVTTATIHATSLRMLNFFWADAVGGAPFEVLQRRDAELRRIADAVNPNLEAGAVRDLVSQIELAKARGLDPQSYKEMAEQRTEAEIDSNLVADVWSRYADWCSAQRLIDFDDVLQLLTGLLESRPDLLMQVRKRYDWFTVDEYQDITPLQQALLALWVGERAELCVVGDPQQSIYEFAGATPRPLLAFGERFPNATIVELDESYRCAPEIAEFANKLATAGGLQMRSLAAAGSVQLVEFPTAELELRALAETARQLVADGVDVREIAVLTRLGSQLDDVERALGSVGVPASSRPNDRFFEHPLVKRALLILRAWSTDHAPVESAVVAAVVEAGWSESTDDAAIWQAGSSLIGLARDFVAATPESTVSDFLAEVNRRAAALDVPRPPAVQLLTMHSAKGLEWDHVFLPGTSNRLLPYPGAPVSSERNLLYVAATRARKTLQVSWALQDERGRSSSASPFLAEMPSGLRAANGSRVGSPVEPPQPVVPATQPVARCRICTAGLATASEHAVRRCQRCPSDVDPQLLADLGQWRSRAASLRGIPEWLLLPNLTLQALAELRPTSLAELASLPGLNETRIAEFGGELVELVLRS